MGASMLHAGPEEDVLLHVIAGSGALRSGEGELIAGADGLRYLSVHRRKPGLREGRRP